MFHVKLNLPKSITFEPKGVKSLPSLKGRRDCFGALRAPRNDKRLGYCSHGDCHGPFRALAMTDLRAQREKGHPTVFGAPNHYAVLGNDLPFPVIARKDGSPSEAIPTHSPSLRGVLQGTTKQSLTEYYWNSHTIALQGPEIAASLRSSQ